MVKGSCYCGEIEYEAELIKDKIFNCHCSQCRKSHGSAFATQAFAKGESFKFLKGEEFISEYKGDHCIRAFCKNCGSRLMNYAADKNDYLSIALSTLDGDFDFGPIAHVYTAYKAPWNNPSNDIPSFKELPDGILK